MKLIKINKIILKRKLQVIFIYKHYKKVMNKNKIVIFQTKLDKYNKSHKLNNNLEIIKNNNLLIKILIII